MVRAVEGMIKEKDAIFAIFFISIILFQVSTVAASFLVMSSSAAWTSMVLCLGGLYIWYVYCLRIYNRFKVRKRIVTSLFLFLSLSLSFSHIS